MSVEWLIIEALALIWLSAAFEKWHRQKLTEDEMAFRLKIWLIERGCNVL
ncbi:hypothetical protein HYE54_09530 [Aggregatibacter actinomycetemcomitans]|nr:MULTISPECIES: hypothetical protein [Aggregatibacter]MBN6060164.1 hypothetical protein [Aggregatibacter actinomycetemcomitans]MBN6068960.1 hypothetical protein [Aggregatibacter actinomycetemcomitans]MBN6087040.1 hypothetical protein [Aggregatibacter actinomycetemcomitans]MBN6088869.1 hypothetical protein [Aggregatibacter actinomycetemcomitans]